MSYEIVCTRGPMKGRRWNVTQQGLKIGRAEGCEIQLDDVAADLYHCVVKLVDGKPSVQNLASDSGVDVNGTNVDGAELDSNDTIRIGNERFILFASGGEKGGSGVRKVVAAAVLIVLAAVGAYFYLQKSKADKPEAVAPAVEVAKTSDDSVTTNRVVRLVSEELLVTNRIVKVVDNVVVTNYVVEVRHVGQPQEPERKRDAFAVALPERTDGLVLSEDGHTLVSVPKELPVVVIPNGVTTIGEKAFENHKALVHVSIPPSVTRIGRDAFLGCKNLVGVFITDIAAWCRTSFDGWGRQPMWGTPACLYFNGSLVKSLVIPNGTTKIVANAFRGDNSLTSVTIPESVTEIGSGAFADCANLDRIDVADANRCYKSIDGLLLSKDGRVLVAVPGNRERVTIPHGVVSIWDRAFLGCHRLTKITVPDGVTSIGFAAFAVCGELESISIPPSVMKIGGNAFDGDNRLSGIYVTDIAAWCRISFGGNPLVCGHNLYLNEQLVHELETPKEVPAVNRFAFYGCTSLNRVTIPRNVERIEGSAFGKCLNLVAFEVAGGNQRYKAKNGLLLSKDGRTLIAVPSGLENVTIPDNVEHIGRDAFYGCDKLFNVAIPNGVRSVGDFAFAHCKALASVAIPSSVKSINTGAFRSCPSLANVTISGIMENIGDSVFEDSGLASVTIPKGIKRIDRDAFRNTRLKSVTIPDSVTNIAEKAFADCKQLESVTIPADLKNIHETAFAGCNKLMDANKRPRLTRVPSTAKRK